MTQAAPKRGIWLAFFIIFMVLSNAITASSYFTNAEQVASTVPNLTPTFVQLLGLGTIMNVVFAAAIWNWKRWGLYGFYAMSVLAAAVNLYLGFNLVWVAIGLSGAAILFLLVRKKWEHFK